MILESLLITANLLVKASTLDIIGVGLVDLRQGDQARLHLEPVLELVQALSLRIHAIHIGVIALDNTGMQQRVIDVLKLVLQEWKSVRIHVAQSPEELRQSLAEHGVRLLPDAAALPIKTGAGASVLVFSFIC